MLVPEDDPLTTRLSPFIPGSKQKRPAPPPELNVREAKIWTKITRRLPADWFTASAPLLKELCRHSRLADNLSEDIARAQTAIDESPEDAGAAHQIVGGSDEGISRAVADARPPKPAYRRFGNQVAADPTEPICAVRGRNRRDDDFVLPGTMERLGWR